MLESCLPESFLLGSSYQDSWFCWDLLFYNLARHDLVHHDPCWDGWSVFAIYSSIMDSEYLDGLPVTEKALLRERKLWRYILACATKFTLEVSQVRVNTWWMSVKGCQSNPAICSISVHGIEDNQYSGQTSRPPISQLLNGSIVNSHLFFDRWHGW